MKLPVVLLPSSASSGARERTLVSLSAQSIEVEVLTPPEALVRGPGEFIALVLSGTVLDATACERAVWFLASHPGVPCVTGASTTPATNPSGASVMLASALQFVVVRMPVARRLLVAGDAPQAATAMAIVIRSRRESGRGTGWVSDPLIRANADSTILMRIEAEARAALQQLALDEAGLFDLGASGVPVAPQQALATVTWPDIDVKRAPTSGMRILALLQGFPMGGYTAFNAELLPSLSAAGHAVTTCTTEFFRTDWRQDLVRDVAPDIHHAHAVVPSTAVPAYIDWLIASRTIDVVLLSHSYLGFHVLPYLRARHPAVAFVDYVHTDWFESAMYGSYATMASRFEGQLDAQLATSDALVSQLIDAGCDASAVRAAHIGIDTTAWRHAGPRLEAVRTSLGATTDTVVLLFSGRISPEKRPELAVDAMAQLRSEGVDALLVFAGGGQLLQATHARSVTLGVESHCKFLGELDEATLRHVYAAADLFIAPSEIEGIARSLYEAMAMGCVPVVSDVGGQRELVIDGTGSLVNASCADASPYVDGVRPWLDRDVRGRASAAARAHIVALFDSGRTVETVCDVLRLGMTRRPDRQETLPGAMAEELAVMAIEVMRRHVLKIVSR